MSIKIGSNSVSSIYLGNTQLYNVKLQDALIFLKQKFSTSSPSSIDENGVVTTNGSIDSNGVVTLNGTMDENGVITL